MSDVEPNIGGPFGPRFFKRDGEWFFQHIIDARNSTGARPVREGDREAYPTEWSRDVSPSERPPEPPKAHAEPKPHTAPKKRGRPRKHA